MTNFCRICNKSWEAVADSAQATNPHKEQGVREARAMTRSGRSPATRWLVNGISGVIG